MSVVGSMRKSSSFGVADDFVCASPFVRKESVTLLFWTDSAPDPSGDSVCTPADDTVSKVHHVSSPTFRV